jgi:hypothetical protein
MPRPAPLLCRSLRLVLPAVCLLIVAGGLRAASFRVQNGPTPSVSLTVGSSGAAIDQVSFQVGSGQLGNGQPVTGSPAIRITVTNRAVPPFSRTATLTMDSSTPLRNGTSELRFSTISWTSRSNRIPAGKFDDSSDQTLLTTDNPRNTGDVLQFRYANSSMLEAGVYSGRVTYTLTMP